MGDRQGPLRGNKIPKLCSEPPRNLNSMLRDTIKTVYFTHLASKLINNEFSFRYFNQMVLSFSEISIFWKTVHFFKKRSDIEWPNSPLKLDVFRKTLAERSQNHYRDLNPQPSLICSSLRLSNCNWTCSCSDCDFSHSRKPLVIPDVTLIGMKVLARLNLTLLELDVSTNSARWIKFLSEELPVRNKLCVFKCSLLLLFRVLLPSKSDCSGSNSGHH